MKRSVATFLFCALPLSLGLSGCGQQAPSLQENLRFHSAFQQVVGDLANYLDQETYDALQEEFYPIWMKYDQRDEKNRLSASSSERRQWKDFSQTLDQLTDDALSLADTGYYAQEGEEEEESELADFPVAGGQLGEMEPLADWEDYPYTPQELESLWVQAESLLPEGALEVFTTYTAFTDGELGTLGYVYWDIHGEEVTWGLALDPADSWDEISFQETVLHEYFHYLSLNESQIDFNGRPDGSTYWEDGMVAYDGSYLNLFYQAFWPPLLLEERLANPDSTGFFLRHYSRFCDEYASTSPSEDIAECFALYCLWEDNWYQDEGLEQWEEKIAWFDQFPELSAFRDQVQSRLSSD